MPDLFANGEQKTPSVEKWQLEKELKNPAHDYSSGGGIHRDIKVVIKKQDRNDNADI